MRGRGTKEKSGAEHHPPNCSTLEMIIMKQGEANAEKNRGSPCRDSAPQPVQE
jgi:hypothetical protein